jgi:hypothetical protein
MLLKLIVIAFMLLIVGSLGSALVFLYKDQGKTDRTVKALTVRISLSLILFLLLMVGYYFGIVHLHGVGG